MVEPEPKVEPSTPVASQEIPNAFSQCANCSISYQGSSNPVESVLLVCLHSFCRKCINEGCLRSEKGDSNLVTCCKCKCNSNRADCGINLLADVARESKNTIKCSSCNDQTSATSTCTICKDMLCDACVSAHKRVKLTREHPIVALTNSTDLPNGASTTIRGNKRYSCAKHASEKLQLFCEPCNKVTCTKCHEIAGDHYNHPSSDINQAAASFRNNLRRQLVNLQEKDKTVSKALGVVMEKMGDIDSAESKALAEVKEYYNTCMEAVRNRMNGLGSEIRKLAASKRGILEKMKEDVGHLQSRLDETSRAVDHAANCGDPIALLSVRKGMAHHMATLLKLKCQVPNPSHRLNIQLQTDPALLSQIIPQLGAVLVDGAMSSFPIPASASQAAVNTPHIQQMSNGLTPTSSQTTGIRAPRQPHQAPRMTQRTVHHRAGQPTSIQHQHPTLFNHVNSSHAMRPPSRSAVFETQQTGKPTDRTPSPLPAGQQLLPPSLTSAASDDKWQPDAAGILRQAAAEVSAKTNQNSNSSRLSLHLDGNTDPLNVNGMSPGSSSQTNPKNNQRLDNLKISSVMSLADEISKSNNGSVNGEITPPKDIQLAVRKRKKTALSPFHVATHHAPVEGLIGDYCEPKNQMGRPSVTSPLARKTQRHFIDTIPNGKRRKCVVCAKPRHHGDGYKKTRIRTWCKDCDVGLCKGECFRRYHT
ncbi:E3 ubiquitin-protein ligase TRIM33-like isoform X2 [Watersipora subatra]|uniref:E3 ubiquitin-protein ligase TRIM33-like isoform X2 n=1 Tax=Watersipora subatra TaxID=2589382 RepID=UPI00355C1217